MSPRSTTPFARIAPWLVLALALAGCSGTTPTTSTPTTSTPTASTPTASTPTGATGATASTGASAVGDPFSTDVAAAFRIDAASLRTVGSAPDPARVWAGDASLLDDLIPVVAAADEDFAPLVDSLDELRDLERDVLAQTATQLATPQPTGPGNGLRFVGPVVLAVAPTAAPVVQQDRTKLGASMAELLIIVDLMGTDLKDVLAAGGSQTADGTTLEMQLNTGGPPGSAKDFSFKVKLERDGVTIETTIKGSLKGDPCPDEAGEVHAEFSYSVVGSGSAGGRTVGMQTEVKGTAVGYVDDAAKLTGFEVDATAGDAAQRADGRNSFVELHTGGRLDGDFTLGATPTITSDSTRTTVTRHSQDANRADAESAAQVGVSPYGFVATAFSVWESQWRSGKCVKVVADAPGRVDLGAHVDIEAKVVHRDGQELPLPIDLSLSGPTSADPTRIDEAPGTVTYVAADEPDRTGTITWTSTSRRGIGTLSTAITTRPKSAYRVAGGADDLVVDDVVCDVTVPFSLEGSGVVQQFVPASDTAGSYTYSGTMAGFGVEGSGTYTITFPDGPDAAGTMVSTGPGSVKTPAGTFSNTGTERYTLTPFEPSEEECPSGS